MSKESNRDEMMKDINVQREIEYCQNYEKIEELCPRVGTSVRECNPVFCLVFYPSTWGVLEERFEHEVFVLMSLLLDPESI